MSTNHTSINLVTKGLLNISNITKGLLNIIGYQIVLRKRGGSSAKPITLSYGKNEEKDFFDNIRKQEEIDYIKVNVEWKKSFKGNKFIEVKLIKEHIQAQTLKETGKNIIVELL